MYMVLLGVGAGANIGGYNVHGLTWCGAGANIGGYNVHGLTWCGSWC